MAFFSIPGIRVAGIAACVPKNKEHNADYAWISRKEREQLIKIVGVETRHVISPGTTTSDLCLLAAQRLLADLTWDRDEIGLLIFVSQTRDYLIPATSGILQDKLGLPKSAISLDVNQGCSGFIYGMALMGSLMKSAGIRKGLLMVGDISSLNASYRDKSTHPLFGDAGTVTAIEISGSAGEMHFNLEGDGSGYQAIMIPDGGFRSLPSKKSFTYKKHGTGIYRNDFHIALNGIEVFDFCLREVVPNIKSLLQQTSRTLREMDYVVFHQANKLITETLRKMLKLDPAKVPYSIAKYGNTSSASVPLTMVSELGETLKKKPVRLLLSAFGIGLSWGSLILETDGIICPEIIEY
jgi:3-oxoacyl-[acyl-carrier-protein] synthase-3